MNWTGPYTVDQLLGSCFGSGSPMPPEANGVYLVSEKAWTGRPTKQCKPLFVGSNTQNPERFRLRVGHIIIDAFGFFGDDSNASGGRTLHEYCVKNKLNPKQLHVGWVENCHCPPCAKIEIWRELLPALNKNRPARCQQHGTKA